MLRTSLVAATPFCLSACAVLSPPLCADDYALPFPPSAPFKVTQGYDGRLSHQGEFALDFEMPEGTPIHAARAGKVGAVVTQFSEGAFRFDMTDRSNVIWIRHYDGSVGEYRHLRHRGEAVQMDQEVREGDLLGYSGNTGFSTGPHLHFVVYRFDEQGGARSLPVTFRTAHGRCLRLYAGRHYKRY